MRAHRRRRLHAEATRSAGCSSLGRRAGAARGGGEEGVAATKGTDPDAPTVEDEIRDNFPYQRSEEELLEELRVAGLNCLPQPAGGLAREPLGGSAFTKTTAVAITTVVVVGVGCLVDRSGGTARFPVPSAALATVAATTWKPEDCPLCTAGGQAIKPGSRT